MKKIFKSTKTKIALVLAVVLCIVVGAAMAANIPKKVTPLSGVNLMENNKSTVDYSNIAEGYISVKYTGGKDVRIKLQITKTGGSGTYTYDLNNKGTYETFPLTDGNGDYSIKVFENVDGTKYSQAFSTSLNATLRDELLPFLYPNQYVNFNDNSKVVAKAAELCSGKTKDIEKVSAVYNYVVNNFTYDYNKMSTVQSGYLPVVDTILDSKTGICFDYAAVMASMLRSQNVPCKLVIGYAGTTYHAWVSIYLEGEGWVDAAIYFNGEKWSLMDPTYASTGNSSSSAIAYITNEANYKQCFAY